MMRVILASGSPRRRELLNQIGIDMEVLVSNVEEVVTTTKPWQVVEELSAQKAAAVYDTIEESDICVIGSDTVVALGDEIMGKPKSEADAADMLRKLAGNTHAVYTGVTLCIRRADGSEERKTFHEKTDVIFYNMTEEEIAEYVATGDCMDKAGAYGIQGFCARYIKGIVGDYNTVVGLPAGRLYQEVKQYL